MTRMIEVECKVTKECYYGNAGEDKRRYSPDKPDSNRLTYRGPEKPFPSYLQQIGRPTVLSDDSVVRQPIPAPRRAVHVADTLASQSNEARIRTALERLNPENNDHWTKGGEPSIAAVEDAGGFQPKEIGRAEVQSAWPEFDRDFARDYIPAGGKA